MKYLIVNRPVVAIEIEEAVNYYKKISPALAKRFLFRIREAKDYLASSPFGFMVRYKNVRTILLWQFPYHIHYFIDETQNVIVILGIVHAYKNPEDYSLRF